MVKGSEGEVNVENVSNNAVSITSTQQYSTISVRPIASFRFSSKIPLCYPRLQGPSSSIEASTSLG